MRISRTEQFVLAGVQNPNNAYRKFSISGSMFSRRTVPVIRND